MVKEKTEKKSKIWIVLGVLILVLVIVVAALFFIFNSEKGREKLSDVPVVSSFLPAEDNGASNTSSGTQGSKTDDIEAQQKEEIDELEREIDSLEDIVDDQDKEIKKLEKSEESESENDEDNEEEVDEVKQTASSFRKMDPEKAARIVENLDKSIAIEVLEKLSGDVRGGILAEMDSKKAAELTEGMMNE